MSTTYVRHSRSSVDQDAPEKTRVMPSRSELRSGWLLLLAYVVIVSCHGGSMGSSAANPSQAHAGGYPIGSLLSESAFAGRLRAAWNFGDVNGKDASLDPTEDASTLVLDPTEDTTTILEDSTQVSENEKTAKGDAVGTTSAPLHQHN